MTLTSDKYISVDNYFSSKVSTVSSISMFDCGKTLLGGCIKTRYVYHIFADSYVLGYFKDGKFYLNFSDDISPLNQPFENSYFAL